MTVVLKIIESLSHHQQKLKLDFSSRRADQEREIQLSHQASAPFEATTRAHLSPANGYNAAQDLIMRQSQALAQILLPKT